MKEKFIDRHIGINNNDREEMLRTIGLKSIEDLINETIPLNIRNKKELNLPKALSESEMLEYIENLASKNKIFKTYIGQGYYGTILPSVIKRNILENPNWYTPYTPYQAEISQGRLEALFNFQTVICSLTGMELANSSLLDESTAAAEAMIMLFRTRSLKAKKTNANKFFVDEKTFPQTIEVLKTRAKCLNIELIVGDYHKFKISKEYFGISLQYPNSDGKICDYKKIISLSAKKEIKSVIIADLMSLVILTPPSEMGADVVVGSTQRFGLPMGFGGPHAGYFATRDKYKRNIPGRIIGETIDSKENKALRLALQTREQHIKRDKATSNICTAQALMASMSGMYAVYHGTEGLKIIANRIHLYASAINTAIKNLGYKQENKIFFDTLKISIKTEEKFEEIIKTAIKKKINFRYSKEELLIYISIGEDITEEDLNNIISIFNEKEIAVNLTFKSKLEKNHLRKDEILSEKLFKQYHSETEMMRYIKYLENKDITLMQSMTPLGSCTMKLNAATEMFPISWSKFANIHPFVPINQAKGYIEMISELEQLLCEITGFEACSMQPNSGAAGEYAGLLLIREYLKKHNSNRNIMLIPASAHGTNPASCIMAGFKIIVVKCDGYGNVDITDIKIKVFENKENLAGCMITYPSTHGIFEEDIIQIINLIHKNGGLVYMDGANMNAQIGYTSPGTMGADVCHLNLHKTFASPHGGGGPGMGPICVNKKLEPFLPKHPLTDNKITDNLNTISSAHFGSALLLTISYCYIKMLGYEGLKKVTESAIISANYLATILDKNYGVLYKGINGRVGHELILDCQEFKQKSGVGVVDIAKRLIDYGFHAPTLSFPVHDTLMIEPTESESKKELDKFIKAMSHILLEIGEVINDKADKEDNVLLNSPHTLNDICTDDWEHKYSREKAAFPIEELKTNKYWSPVNRVNDAFGDRTLICKIIENKII